MWWVRIFQKGEREALVANSTIYDPDWRDEDKKWDLPLTTSFFFQFLGKVTKGKKKLLTTGTRIKITHLSANRNMPSIMNPVRCSTWFSF